MTIEKNLNGAELTFTVLEYIPARLKSFPALIAYVTVSKVNIIPFKPELLQTQKI